MSDDNGDAEFEASLANLDVSGFEGSSGQLPGTSDPDMAARLDSLHSTLSTLGMRIDALVTSTTTYRSSLTDRLTEYADLVTKLTRTQSNDLEEHRRATERTIADLRRSLGTSEEVLDRVGSRLDAMLTETETSDDAGRRMLAEVRSILDAQESLSRFITESLDQFADRVMERMDVTQTAGSQQLDALQTAIDEIAARDMTRGVRDDLAELRSMVVDLRAQDPSSSLDQMRETLLDVASGEVVGALWDEVRELRSTLDEVRSRSADTVGLLGDLSARTDSSPGAAAVEGLSTELASVREHVSGLVAAGAETASASAVESLRAEIAGVRATIEAALEVDDTPEPVVAAPDPAIASLRDDVTTLVASVRDLLDQAEVVDESVAEPGGGMLTAVAADVAVLRHELSQGLIVEPSDALANTVDELRNDLAQLRDRMQVLADLEVAIEGLVANAASPAGSDGATPAAGGWAEDSDAMADEMRSMRSGIEDIIARLDEGLVLAQDELAPPAAAPSPAVADQLASLKDQISAEFDSLRQVAARTGAQFSDDDAPAADGDPLAVVTELLEHVRDDIAELPERIGTAGAPAASAPAAEGQASIDPDTIDLLRQEIRSAGGVSDEVTEALRKELVALRRRIRLRAEGEIFSEEQLEIIADAVARKLAD